VAANSTKKIEGCDSFKFLALAPDAEIKFRTTGKYEQNEFLTFFNMVVKDAAIADDYLTFKVDFTLLDPAFIVSHYDAHKDGFGFDSLASYFLKGIENKTDLEGQTQILDTVVGEYMVGFDLNSNMKIKFKLTITDADDLASASVSDVQMFGPYYYSEKFQPIFNDTRMTGIKKYYPLKYLYIQHLDGLGNMDSIELWNDTNIDISVLLVAAS
jgi:hypothetical protein